MIHSFSHRLYAAIVFFILLSSNNLFSADYFWVNGSGNWNDPAHWSTTSGGPSSGTIPGILDDVIFDENSFSDDYPIIEIPTSVIVRDFVVSSSKYPSFVGDLASLTIKNELSLQNRTHFFLNGGIFFDATDAATHFINTFNADLNADLTVTAGNWELQSHFKTTRNRTITFSGGSLKSNDYTIHAQNILATGAPVTLNLGASHILAVNVLNLSSAVSDGLVSAVIAESSSGSTVIEDKGGFTGATTKDVHVDCPNPPFMLDLLITSDYNGADISCPDSCDGELTIIASGTPGPFSFSFESGPFTDQTVYSDLCNDTYDFVVIDSSNELVPGVYDQCIISEGLIEPGAIGIGAPIPISNTCPGVCDGQAFTFPGGGTGPYTLFWPVSGETTPNPVGLCDGWNVVEVLDANLCPHVDSVEITGPPEIVPDFTVTPPTCFGDCDAEVLVTPTGGNGPAWTVSWSTDPASGAGTNPGIGFCSGTYTLTVFDNNLCSKDTTVIIVDPPLLTVTVDGIVDATCNGDCDGQANANPAGGTPTYSFEWFDNATLASVSTDQNPTTLCAGDYFVVVTDDNGCTATSAVITINEPPPFTVNQDAYSVSCFGICDGAVDVDASGATPGYTYSWTTFPGGVGIGATDSISGLCPGFYQVTVTDAVGCDTTMAAIEVIEPPAVTLALSSTDPTCYDLCDGTATATPGGGTPPYTFTWTPLPPIDGTTATPSGMCAGTYNLLLTDNNGCTATGDVTLTSPAVYDISETITDLLCFGDSNGSIDLTVNSGGDGGPYTFSWFPVPPVGDGTPNVSGLTAGTWTVTVADGNGCDTTLSYTVTEPTELIATGSLISNVSCFGDCSGSASVAITGGTPTYGISWAPSGQTTPVASSLCAGVHTVTVTDDNGCVATDDVLITQPNEFVLDTSQTNNLCASDCNGTATVNVLSGGTPTYNILWDDPLAQTTFTAIGLCAGTYTATVTDANLCDTIITFTITEPPVMVIDTNVLNSACFGSCSGEANVTVTGGTPAYSFEWFNAATGLTMGVTTAAINSLCPGDYYCAVTDANGCTLNSDTITITELPEIITSTISTTDATCGLCDGTAEVSATGGAGGFTYTWTPAPGTGQGTSTVTGLCDGVYSVDITDANGCTALMSVTINSLAIEIMDMDSTDVSCFGLCDGTVTASWGSLDAPYTLEWFDEGTGLPIGGPITPANPAGETLTGQCAGTYIAVITNNTGCVTSDTISITEPAEITGTITSTDVTCNGMCDGTADIVAAGGAGGFTYNWVPLPGGGQGTPNAIGLCAGTWDVEVTDADGCTVTFSTAVSEPPAILIDLEASTDISCFGADDGTATVAASGGTAPYTFEWFDCATGLPIGQTTATATGLSAGSYECVITDANGCTVTSSCLPVVEPTEITATINIQNVSCFGDCDGMIDVIPAGGAGTYFFQWEDATNTPIAGQTNDTITGLCQDFYNLTITDINGCTASFGPFDLTPPADAWDITTDQTNITCSGSCDGIASVIVNAGNNPPYTYLWDDPLIQVTPT
ncbi:MAG: SprB repeat-containing protein, partial [Flavobacteriales bacterium]|nr:SprB repeat-containing protein [Flavobacteriales bacterium]